MTRWNVVCDSCGASAWIGPGAAGGAWCEACQRAAPSAADRCEGCGRALTHGEPRFVEILGELQNLAAVLAAWQGDAAPLAALLPERPRFLSDRNPPASESGDPEWLRAALATLARGDFASAAAQLKREAPAGAEARRRRALAIALERRGDAAEAERVLDGIQGADETPALRLERGALHARRGDLERAREDFARAGDSYEARWNRAALELYQALGTEGAPDPARLAAARRAAGEPSSAWSDHTVGRLLWALLIERAERRGRIEPAVLAAAEREFEFDTFWDRAAVLEGYARLRRADDVARIARPLALELVAALTDQPAIAAAPVLDSGLALARGAIERGDARAASAAIRTLQAREDLPRYRIPCRHCGAGSVGIAEIAEDEADETAEPRGSLATPAAARDEGAA